MCRDRRWGYGLNQDPLDLGLGERRRIDRMHVLGLLTGREQLHRADTITPDRGQEVECAACISMKAILDTFANEIGIGQQVVEIALDGPAFDRATVETERQR